MLPTGDALSQMRAAFMLNASTRRPAMKTRRIGYWTTTAITALAFLAGGVADVGRGPEVVAGMAHLGYPVYFVVLLGVWKLLAAPALLAPGLPRLKEWAYAGIAFDLTGAAVSHAVVGDGPAKIITPLVLLAVAAASWALRPANRALTPANARAPIPVRAAATGDARVAA
jgi:hypothetical protein